MIQSLKRSIAALCLIATAAPATAQGAADIVELLCGRTVHYASVAMGNQIEYTDPDGNAYLWHPYGSGGVVKGTWRLEFPDGAPVEVCYTYPDGSFGLATVEDYCFTYDRLLLEVPLDGIRDGDPYDLSSGSAPFPLPLAPLLSPSDLIGEFPDTARGPGCAAYVS